MTDTVVYGKSYEERPTARADSNDTGIRVSKHGNVSVEPTERAAVKAALEERAFVATNPTPSTAIAIAIKATHDDEKAELAIQNDSNDESIILDQVRLICTVAPASGTDAQLACILDSVARSIATDGTGLSVKNPNMASDELHADVVARFGALVPSATTATERQVARAQLRSVILVVGDELVLRFGDDAGPPSVDIAGTTAKKIVTNLPPIVIAPGGTLLVHLWFASNATTPAQFEVEVQGHKR
jgi:hypothetical protein